MKYLIIVFLIVGCATTPTKFNYLSVGMSKPEVIDLLGTPYSSSANKNAEYLTYSYNRGPLSGLPVDGVSHDYFVRIINGKVESYGKVGDFDSTKNHESTINLNVNNKR